MAPVVKRLLCKLSCFCGDRPVELRSQPDYRQGVARNVWLGGREVAKKKAAKKVKKAKKAKRKVAKKKARRARK